MAGTTLINGGDTEAILRDAGIIPEAEPVAEEKAAPEPEAVKEEAEIEDAEDDFAKRIGLTKDQHEQWTKTVKKAVDKQYRGRKEAEEFATFQYNQAKLAEERAERAERELNRLRAQAEPTPKADEAPRREDFPDTESYFEARTDWRIKQERKAWEADQAKAREQEAQQRIINEAKARVDKAKELVPDYLEVLDGADMVVPPHIAGYMQESEMIAELGYHFAKNPETLEKLSKLSPARALVEIGKIESKLVPFGEKSETSKKTSTTAPEPSQEVVKRAESPINPLPSGSRAQVTKPPEQMTYEDALRDFESRSGRKFGRRSRH